jgi:hypothetical protein
LAGEETVLEDSLHCRFARSAPGRIVCTICGFERAWPDALEPYLTNCPGASGGRTPPVGCLHRGEETRRVECPGCRGNVQLKVYACAHLSECVLAGQVEGLASCATCSLYEVAAQGLEPAARVL